MAFTSAQATQIRAYLGYPQVYRISNPRLEGAITQVGSDADATAYVLTILADIATALTTMMSMGLTSAGVKTLDKGDVELHPQLEQIRGIQRVGRIRVAALSGIFGVPVETDIFGETGYASDAWKLENGRPTLAGLG